MFKKHKKVSYFNIIFVFQIKTILHFKGIGVGVNGLFYIFILFNLVLTKLQDAFRHVKSKPKLNETY